MNHRKPEDYQKPHSRQFFAVTCWLIVVCGWIGLAIAAGGLLMLMKASRFDLQRETYLQVAIGGAAGGLSSLWLGGLGLVLLDIRNKLPRNSDG